MLPPLFKAFAKASPITVMVAGLIARLFHAEKLDRLFEEHADRQYTNKLLFSTLFDLMSLVVCGVRRSIHAAYQASTEELAVSLTSIYNKLNAMETGVSEALVRDSAAQTSALVNRLEGASSALLPGYRTLILDGHCIASSEHRIEELRHTNAGALPGKALVVYDPSLKLVVDVFTCEDGHAQERSLFDTFYERVEAEQLWVADRNFCTFGFLFTLAEKGAFTLVREHKMLRWQAVTELGEVGRGETGVVSEQRITLSWQGRELALRRIVLVLDTPTSDGDTEIVLLTNVEGVSAIKLAEIYRERWLIEGVFQELEAHLSGEIVTLGHPKAALFAFCTALVAYNVLSVVKAALGSVYGHEKIKEEVSGYYIADEVAGTYRGMLIAIPWAQWSIFYRMSDEELGTVLQELAGKVRLSAFKKHKRGPKKKPPPKRNPKKETHVSTSKLLAQRKKK